jgi:CheY-like chemotaxis protein
MVTMRGSDHGSRPDVVLLDLHMPGCSGWEVLESAAGTRGAPPVL